MLSIPFPVSGLVLTGVAGSVVTIPTSVLLLGKGLLLKKLLIKKGLEKGIIISFFAIIHDFSALLARELLSEENAQGVPQGYGRGH